MSTSSSTSSHQESVFIEIQHLNVSNKIRVHNKIAMGGYSDVWHGTIEDEEGTIEVAIKELRVCHRQSSIPHEERLRKRFLREVLVWEKLHHRNIVPLLGWAMRPDHLPRLVSPWYPNGNVIEYLQKHPDTDRPKLLLDVARGLTYLHSLPLVHGDVKGENVLVDAEGCARLGDFGMSTFIDHALHITGFTTTTQGGGTPRCSAPELLYDEQKTKKTDIWAFGCTAIQIITSLVPYPDLYRITAIQASIMCGNPPLPPEYTAPTPQETVLWEDIRRCWLSPDDRPEINWLAERIDELYFHPFNPTTTHAWHSVSNVATDVQGRRSSLGQPTKRLGLRVCNPDPEPTDDTEVRAVRPLPRIPPQPPSPPPPYEERIIISVLNRERRHKIDITGLMDATSIRKHIYSKLRISPSEESRFKLYRLDHRGQTGPVDNNTLIIYCAAWGDSSGTLTFMLTTS